MENITLDELLVEKQQIRQMLKEINRRIYLLQTEQELAKQAIKKPQR